MSASDLVSGDDGENGSGEDGPDPDVLRGELAVLREENRRLRAEYARARQSQYTRSAATLVGVGVLAVLAGFVVASGRSVLFALGGTSVVLGALTYFLTPERFVSASVGEAVYASLARNEAQTAAELGLTDDRVYVPGAGGTDESGVDVRLFVPQHADYAVPDPAAVTDRFVVTDDRRERGLSARPTAADLYADFEGAATADVEDPAALGAALADAIVEQFELAGSATADVDADGGQAAIRVTESTLGRVDRVDHPVASLAGVAFASTVGRPVTTEVAPADDDAFVVSASWAVDD